LTVVKELARARLLFGYEQAKAGGKSMVATPNAILPHPNATQRQTVIATPKSRGVLKCPLNHNIKQTQNRPR
jgi:hypothetical protein